MVRREVFDVEDWIALGLIYLAFCLRIWVEWTE